MRHRKVSRKLGRDAEHHKAILRNMVTDLFKYGKITTTLAKAKELRRVADKMITLAKRGDLTSRRRALAFIRDKNIVRKLFSELREKYLNRAGGYTRVIKIGPRRGDASMMAIVELVEEKITTKRSKLKKERLKKIVEFIEKKKREYGLIKETSSQKETKEEVSKSEEKTESE
ncbi:MAG: Ribosomal protein L17 [Thermodesulfobacteria bacterium]|nr:Ribosomal protein L17 [Thermodesulfobacteriota bacterium]